MWKCTEACDMQSEYVHCEVVKGIICPSTRAHICLAQIIKQEHMSH